MSWFGTSFIGRLAGKLAPANAPERVPEQLLVRADNVSDAFMATIQAAVDEIEPNAQKRVLDAGYIIEAVPSVKAAAPDIMDRHAGEHNGIPRVEFASAFVETSKKRALVAERKRDFTTRKWVQNERATIGVHHEFGHLMDLALKNISQSPLFEQAHRQDVATLRRRLRRRDLPDVAYFTSMDRRGRQEAFAEQVGQTYGARSVDHDLAVLMPATGQFVAILKRNIAADRYPMANISENTIGIKKGWARVADRGAAILFPMPDNRLNGWRLRRAARSQPTGPSATSTPVASTSVTGPIVTTPSVTAQPRRSPRAPMPPRERHFRLR